VVAKNNVGKIFNKMLFGITERKNCLGKLKLKWEDNIKVDLGVKNVKV
jgi:hypothetical protein